MGVEEGKSKLSSAMGSYGSMAGGSSSEGVGHPGHGFKMPAGSNGSSSGPALPISNQVDNDPMCPASEGSASDDDQEASEESGDEGGEVKL